jgi:hypothetical protein
MHNTRGIGAIGSTRCDHRSLDGEWVAELALNDRRRDMAIRGVGSFSELRRCGHAINCRGCRDNQAVFYWHLGDLRAIYAFDEDFRALHRLNPSEVKGGRIIGHQGDFRAR